jgi:hypothetical protein
VYKSGFKSWYLVVTLKQLAVMDVQRPKDGIIGLTHTQFEFFELVVEYVVYIRR